MKKLLLILLLFFVATNQAFAKRRIKTQGIQLQGDAIYTYAKHRYITDTSYYSVRRYTDRALGGGVNLKYVYNIDDVLPSEPLIPFFVFSEVFGQHIGTSALDTERDRVNIDNRYGIKFGAGSDVADNLFVYASVGLAAVEYEIDWKSIKKNKSGRKLGAIYGGGIGYHFGKTFLVSLEFNMQDLEFKTPVTYTGNPTYGNITNAEANLKTLQLGFGFQF